MPKKLRMFSKKVLFVAPLAFTVATSAYKRLGIPVGQDEGSVAQRLLDGVVAFLLMRSPLRDREHVVKVVVQERQERDDRQ